MIRRVALTGIIAILFTLSSWASHLMGGEITWVALTSGPNAGSYVFTLKLYRDCAGIPVSPSGQALDVANHPSITSIGLSLVSQTDISPTCYPGGPAISCGSPQPGAVEEYIFQSAPIVLSGVPPAAGWIFSWKICCRNTIISNLQNPSTEGFTLRAVMFSYNGQNAYPAFDSSPQFLERPNTVICTGNPFTYNHNAVDPELDSLSYDWAEPLDEYSGTYSYPTNPAPLPFNTGYSFQSPLPGPSQDPNNIPATLNSSTGEISYTSYTQGSFVTVIKVSAYKCGQLVSEVYRELQVVLLSCGSNSTPSVTAPFQNSSTNLYTEFKDTVYAGQLVTFNLTGSDPQFLPTGSPQTVTMDFTGNQFGASFTSTTTGCLNPPCATLNPPPPVSGPQTATTAFSWQTDCNHVQINSECNSFSNTYNFVVRTKDDFCPAPAMQFATISITVLGLPVVVSPELKCLNVQPNGDVLLSWDVPDTTNSRNTWNSYHIYSSSSVNGPFTVVDSVFSFSATSYLHSGANANAGPVYYFIRTRSGCGGEVQSPALDTLSTIFVNVNNPNTGIAGLSWNPLSSPNPQGSSNWYRVYLEFPAGVWTLLDSVQTLAFQDTVTVCSAQLNYRVEMDNNIGCVSVSNINGDIFEDNIVPETPLLDTVSVNVSGQAMLGWSASPSGDVIGYIVYQFIAGVWTPIDTTYGNTTSYLNSNSNADQVVEQYRVLAFDSCGNNSPLGTPHKSILMLNPVPDICNASVDLKWTNYINLNPSLAAYDIYVSVNGGAYTFLASNPAGDTTFTHTGLVQFSTYCYIVRARDAAESESTSSSIVCYFANIPQQPVFNYLKVATVESPGRVRIEAFVDVDASVSRYDFYRSYDLLGSYVLLGSEAATGQTIVTFHDGTAETDARSYYYKAVAVDSCGVDAMTSNIARTIYLTAEGRIDAKNEIRWNDYQSWLGGVERYNIFRSVEGEPLSATIIASVPFSGSDFNYFLDDVSGLLQTNGVFSYQIQAVEGQGNTFLLTDSSYSNIAAARQEAQVYIPNAFVPKGLNHTFIPVSAFIDRTDYSFKIYNRWGELIFHTRDASEGWNGMVDGKLCEGGVYVYDVSFKTSEGEYIEKKGTVALIR